MAANDLVMLWGRTFCGGTPRLQLIVVDQPRMPLVTCDFVSRWSPGSTTAGFIIEEAERLKAGTVERVAARKPAAG